jgi:hypothetical protein
MSTSRVSGLRPLARFWPQITMPACLAVLLAVLLLAPVPSRAQMGGMGGMGGGGMGGMGGGGMGGGGMGGMGGGGMGGGGMGGMGGGGGGVGNVAGVVIDAQGVLRTRVTSDPSLNPVRLKAAVEALPGDLQRAVPLRKVALSRLEAELASRLADGREVPDELQKLAGLTRVQYVFVYPAEGDTPGEVVLAGPAEPWFTDSSGRVRGIDTGAPTVLLEDLATAIRCFAPGEPRDQLVGCSIDPKQEGLAALQQFLRRTGRVNPTASVEEIVTGMKEALGTQVVSVQGVPPETHFAQVMVEADYRMKLIGIGLERPPVRMKSWIELASAGSVAANALQRWYFVPDYKCVRIAEDDLAIELVGQAVRLCGADEVVQADGTRLTADRADRASRAFTETFTRQYPRIAAGNPVYAQLRTLVDLVVAAAYMQEHDAYGKAGWEAETLADEAAYPVETLRAPREVETAINAVWKNNRLLTPIGGGVTMHPRLAIDPPNLLMDEVGEVAAARATAKDLPATGWYWD